MSRSPLAVPPDADPRPVYDAVVASAMRYAARLAPERARELAHDVAVELIGRGGDGTPPPSVIYLAVVRRLRDASRGARRRAVREASYLESRADAIPAWAVPGTSLEARELGERIARLVARMPRGMRDVFLLVREEGLSYREAAARLDVGVGTIHTQLSRAGALLRECVRQYEADARDPSLPPPGDRGP